MRPADRCQLRPAWLSSGRSDQLRSAETSSGGSKIGTRFASVLTTTRLGKPGFPLESVLGPRQAIASVLAAGLRLGGMSSVVFLAALAGLAFGFWPALLANFSRLRRETRCG
jgi:hypothetical protein